MCTVSGCFGIQRHKINTVNLIRYKISGIRLVTICLKKHLRVLIRLSMVHVELVETNKKFPMVCQIPRIKEIAPKFYFQY